VTVAPLHTRPTKTIKPSSETIPRRSRMMPSCLFAL
jgi:hypothetical protein